MKLNEKILYYRKAAKLSQEELAEQIGVSRQAVSKWELGDATPEVDKLLLLAKAFGVTTDELLSSEEPGPKAPPAPPQPTAPPSPHSAGDGFDRATGRLGRLIQRYGWLAGIRIALSGVGGVIVGLFARWVNQVMFADIYKLVGEAEVINGPDGIFLKFSNLILIVGIVIIIVGIILAAVLYQKGRKK